MKKKDDGPGDFFGPHQAFSNGRLEFNYIYAVPHLCEVNKSLAKETGYRASELEFAGKRARLQTWGPAKSGWSFMTLCFQDIGDGKTPLHFGAASKDQHALEVAKQIFESVEFR